MFSNFNFLKNEEIIKKRGFIGNISQIQFLILSIIKTLKYIEIYKLYIFISKMT